MFVGVAMEKILDATTLHTDTLSHFSQLCFHMRNAIQLLFNFNYIYMQFTLYFRCILALLRLSLSKSVVMELSFPKHQILFFFHSLCPFLSSDSLSIIHT